ncbi:hypothetical protein B0T25DRAFT_85003 [Lasiosphaeria hispida]|uniref:Uncharacterized protein n=1 Tax=Lasiosphaeria hispida TaxID=260671 RepID=A0AAJ0HPP0_9PEZI|nr:hypothetical protein B0T25DRAFT_85003 [Lasiosphaeria hispida]
MDAVHGALANLNQKEFALEQISTSSNKCPGLSAPRPYHHHHHCGVWRYLQQTRKKLVGTLHIRHKSKIISLLRYKPDPNRPMLSNTAPCYTEPARKIVLDLPGLYDLTTLSHTTNTNLVLYCNLDNLPTRAPIHYMYTPLSKPCLFLERIRCIMVVPLIAWHSMVVAQQAARTYWPWIPPTAGSCNQTPMTMEARLRATGRTVFA